MNEMLLFLSDITLVLILLLVSALFLSKKKNYFDSFITGAKEGISTSFSILPTLCALVISVKMLSVSGALDFVSELLRVPLSKVGVPSELIPFIVTRPVSGSASMAMLDEMFSKYGADSFACICASVIMGSSDTIVYVFSVFFSSVGIRKTRYAVPVAVTVMLFMIFFCCAVCRIMFL